MTEEIKQTGPEAIDEPLLDQATGGGGHVKVFDGASDAEIASDDPTAAKKPGRTSFANIVLERG